MKLAKWKIAAIVGGIVVISYGIYNRFTMPESPIGAMCTDDTICPGDCLGFGDLLPDYSHQQLCTQTCAAAADCPAPTTCRPVTLISSDGKTEEKSYCLP